MINFLEKKLRKIFNCENYGKHKFKERAAGGILVVSVCAVSFSVPFLLEFFLFKINIFLFFLLDLWLGYQSIAAKCLKDEAMNVYKNLKKSLPEGRKAVARIVGRDTEKLTEEGVVKACVETVAENTTDGIFSPAIYFAIGFAPLAILYKAINTMDSMIAYKNERYKYFGTAAAKLDDFANFIPARFCAIVMLFSSLIFKKMNRKENFPPFSYALKIFLTDRKKHESPNSAQTESVMAGILGIQLAGSASYEGKLEEKPFLGLPLKKITPEAIKNSVSIMYLSSIFLIAFQILLTKTFFYFFK